MNPPQETSRNASSQTTLMFEQIVLQTLDRRLVEKNLPIIMGVSKNEHFIKQLWKE